MKIFGWQLVSPSDKKYIIERLNFLEKNLIHMQAIPDGAIVLTREEFRTAYMRALQGATGIFKADVEMELFGESDGK